MPIRLSGLISGMDTDSLVQELVSAYSTKKDNYVKAQTKLEWKMDAWKDLNKKVYSFYTSKLGNMRLSSNYTKKAVTVSDTTKATVSASSSAVNGNQTLAINKIATTGYLTGSQLSGDKNGEAIKSSTKLSDLGGSFSEGMINVKVGDKETNIDITSDMTVSQFVAQLKTAGLNASFDETNQRLFVSSKTSGVDNDFSLTGNTGGVETLKNLGVFSMSKTEEEQYKAIASYTDEQMTELSLNQYLKKQITAANKTYTEENTRLTEENAKLNKELSYANLTSETKAKTYVKLQENISKVQEEIAKLEADTEKDNTAAIEAKQKTLDSYNETLAIYDNVNSTYGITITGDKASEAGFEQVSEPDKEALKEYQKGLTDAISANDEAKKANTKAVEANNKLLEKNYTTDEILSLEFTEFGNDSPLNIAGYAGDSAYTDIYSKFEDMKSNAEKILNKSDSELGVSSGAVRVEGANSEIVLNGAVFTSNTNNYSINGLTITASAVTEPGQDITITTNTDVDGIYNTIKDFFKSYNELVTEMDTLFNASSAKDYEPLTDEEKEAMSESEVEKWETKIKDSLLRRDSTLDGVISTMKTAMSTAFTVGDKTYNLASFGIATSGYFVAGDNEKGVYHIDGDSDDSATSGKPDKLKTMIANDPDTLIDFFSQLSTNLYTKLTNKMSSSSVSSAYTIYNDKEMQRNYDQYKETISKWEDKVTAMEEKYYKQFSAMESALSKLQSSTSSLSALLGQ